MQWFLPRVKQRSVLIITDTSTAGALAVGWGRCNMGGWGDTPPPPLLNLEGPPMYWSPPPFLPQHLC